MNEGRKKFLLRVAATYPDCSICARHVEGGVKNLRAQNLERHLRATHAIPGILGGRTSDSGFVLFI